VPEVGVFFSLDYGLVKSFSR